MNTPNTELNNHLDHTYGEAFTTPLTDAPLAPGDTAPSNVNPYLDETTDTEPMKAAS